MKIDKIIIDLLKLDRDKDYDYTIEEHKDKRSLSSNAYCWVLINKIGNVLRKSKEEVYLDMLINYGQSTVMSMLSSITPNGFFKYYQEIGKSVLGDKEFSHYKIYKGSSEFDTKEQSIFIDGIVQEAKDLDIDTLDEEKIERLVEQWKEK